ncbi:MAG: hypothetical protein H5U08_06630 [Thermogutta sp.]|uniref:hypothetical protein n=1 Tax=Thermogutta sp. TaxID=1962930 RepID=UPI00198E8764|nr:hypothetical protein [Thermogutta sp.]MBC7352016.1 hypothetical protein [Thermogutta sp.]
MNRFTFVPRWDIEPLSGYPIYSIKDYAFDFVPASESQFQARFGSAGEGILVTDTEQLIVGIETGLLLHVYGYSPYMKWKMCDRVPPSSRGGGVWVHCVRPLLSGAGEDVREHLGDAVWFNPQAGWVCLGDVSFVPRDSAVEFASGTVAVIDEGQLRAVWVRPENWHQVAASYLEGGRRPVGQRPKL